MALPPLDHKELGGEHEDIEIQERPGCSHYFEYVTSTSIKCRQCHVGFYVGHGDYLTNGHLYHKGEIVL